jgi:hypothetical protein
MPRTYGIEIERMIIAGILTIPGYEEHARAFKADDFADLDLMELFRAWQTMNANGRDVTVSSLLRFAIERDGEEYRQQYMRAILDACREATGIPHEAFPKSLADVFAPA